MLMHVDIASVAAFIIGLFIAILAWSLKLNIKTFKESNSGEIEELKKLVKDDHELLTKLAMDYAVISSKLVGAEDILERLSKEIRDLVKLEIKISSVVATANKVPEIEKDLREAHNAIRDLRVTIARCKEAHNA